MILNALGTIPLLYVANIFPIYPYTLLTYGLSNDFEFTSLSFYYNFFYQLADPNPSLPKPKILRMLIYY